MAKKILAIDPGNKESGIVIWDGEKIKLREKIDNYDFEDILIENDIDIAVIEMVASYGMAVGATVFETCVWVGRFMEQIINYDIEIVHRMARMDVKMHLCHKANAKDANITQALCDRFAYGLKNKGKGTKKEHGFFYGFKSDIWAAFALAVTFHDQITAGTFKNKYE